MAAVTPKVAGVDGVAQAGEVVGAGGELDEVRRSPMTSSSGPPLLTGVDCVSAKPDAERATAWEARLVMLAIR